MPKVGGQVYKSVSKAKKASKKTGKPLKKATGVKYTK